MTSLLHFLQVEKEIAPEISLFDLFFDEVFQNLISSYDRFYLRSDISFLKFFLSIFRNLTQLLTRRNDWTQEKQGDMVNNKDEGEGLDQKTNLLRQLLLRIKPLILSQHTELQVPSLEIFSLCSPLLHSIFRKNHIYNFYFTVKNKGIKNKNSITAS